MNFRDLEPFFFRIERKKEIGKFVKPGVDPLKGNWTDDDFEEREHLAIYMYPVETLAEADGIQFLHPEEFRRNKGSEGTCILQILFKGKAQYPDMTEPRWNVSGTGLDDLTISPSILSKGNVEWHGWIRNGQVVDA